MKKINTLEAAAIVGGIAAGQCEESYLQLEIGTNISCQLVTTCADKKGNLSQTWKEAAYYNCAA